MIADPTYGFRARMVKAPTVYGNGTVSVHDRALKEYQKDDWNSTTSGRNKRPAYLRATSGSKDYIAWMLKCLKILQITEPSAGVLAGGLALPDGVTATFKAGETAAGQTSDFMTVSDIALGQGSSLSVVPETTATKVAVARVSASGAGTLSASAGAAATVNALSLTGSFGTSKLTASGAVTLSDGLVITVPDEWKRAHGRETILDCSAASGGVPANVVVKTVSGEDVTERATLSVASGCLSACFDRGFILVVR